MRYRWCSILLVNLTFPMKNELRLRVFSQQLGLWASLWGISFCKLKWEGPDIGCYLQAEGPGLCKKVSWQKPVSRFPHGSWLSAPAWLPSIQCCNHKISFLPKLLFVMVLIITIEKQTRTVWNHTSNKAQISYAYFVKGIVHISLLCTYLKRSS